MSDIVPFNSSQLPAYLQNRKALSAAINKDVVTAAQFPTLSIKGKVFTLVRDNERKVMMNPNEPDEVLQSIQLNVLRANAKNRVYYAGSYVEGDSTPPTCQSRDGITPIATAPEPQAKKCAICPHSVWGSKMKDDGTAGEGTECTVNTRLAVTAPDDLKTVYLLRVPAGSRKNYADAVKMADSRGIPYNALVLKVGFDPTAPSPKLTFKPVGLLPDDAYAQASAAYESEMVREIVGLGHVDEPAALPAPVPPGGVSADELDAAIATKAAVSKAATPAPAKVTPKAKPIVDIVGSVKPAVVSMDDMDALVDQRVEQKFASVKAAPPAPAPAPAVKVPAPAMEGLLDELNDLLGMSDD